MSSNMHLLISQPLLPVLYIHMNPPPANSVYNSPLVSTFPSTISSSSVLFICLVPFITLFSLYIYFIWREDSYYCRVLSPYLHLEVCIITQIGQNPREKFFNSTPRSPFSSHGNLKGTIRLYFSSPRLIF